MKAFWDWYDGLQSNHPWLRFSMFMLLATICLVLVPVAFYAYGYQIELGQLVGLAIMGVIVLTKVFRNRFG